ncbi:MAG: glycosyltransferase family 4 protein [Nitrolancea sp.]
MSAIEPIRVLQLVNGEYWSGAERVQALLGTYAGREVDVRFLCLKDGLFIERARELGLAVETDRMRWRFDLLIAQRVAERVRRQRISLIHTHTVRANLIGRIAGLMAGVPVVTHVHSPTLRETDSRLKNMTNALVDRVTSRKSDVFVAVSQSLGDELIRSGVSTRRVSVIPNGIDIPSFCPGAARAEARALFGEPFSSGLLVAMIGLFRPRKGAEVLIDAFEHVSRAVPNACLVMVGSASEDAYFEQLQERCRQRELRDRVLFTGFRGDVAHLMSAFDVVAMPSLYGEGTPMALLESMAMELPVVASPVEGISEVIVDGESGVLSSAGDVNAWANNLIGLLRDSERRREIGQAARVRVETYYSADRMAREVETIYQRVLSGRQRGRAVIRSSRKEVTQ